MEKKKLTIDDLLSALKDPASAGIEMTLQNTKEVWALVGNRDFKAIAEKAGLQEGEVNDFLKTWVEDNPYANTL